MPQTREISPLHRFRRHEFLARAGTAQDCVFRLEDGWACRQRILPDGRRQLTEVFLPGDYCEPQWLLDRRADQSVVALTSVRASGIHLGQANLDRLPGGPTARILLRATVTALNRQADRIVNLGCKSASERLCDLFAELFERMRVNGRASGDRCPMPLTQYDVAEILGLTPVHVNRVMRRLRQQGLFELEHRWLRILDPDLLRQSGNGEVAAARGAKPRV